MGSSKKQSSKILGVVDKLDAERFLLDLVNLSGRGDAVKIASRFLRQHGEILQSLLLHESIEPAHWLYLGELCNLRDYLRTAWDAPDRRAREWHIFHLRRKFAVWSLEVTVEGGDPPPDGVTAHHWDEQLPPLTPLEATMYHFLNLGDLARHCGNPDCPAPYFIAIKRWQKYCSEECSGPGTRESKRNWWNRNRAKNRETL